MFSSERNELRKAFYTAWQKHLTKQPIEPLEAQIIDVMLLHPEYHAFLEDPEQFQTHDFGEINPFLHMSLHLALRDQIKTNRPPGINSIYQNLCQKYSNALDVEHRMMECLERVLWEAQSKRVMPDESEYLEILKAL